MLQNSVDGKKNATKRTIPKDALNLRLVAFDNPLRRTHPSMSLISNIFVTTQATTARTRRTLFLTMILKAAAKANRRGLQRWHASKNRS
jgi:hypothetical protein